MAKSMVEKTPMQRGLDVLIPTLVTAMHDAVGDERVVVSGVEALPKVWRRDSATGPSGQGNKMQNAPKNPLIKKERVGNKPCYECGFAGH